MTAASTTTAALLMIGVMLYGIPLARLLDARMRGPLLAGSSFLLGAGAIGLHLFLLSVIRVPWTRTSILLSLVPLLAISIVLLRRRPALGPEEARASWRPSWIDLFTLAIVASYAIFAVWAPPYEWDFYGIWGLKGRWFFEARGIDWAAVPFVGKPDYPVLIPLLFDFVAIVTGSWNDRAFGWLYVGLSVALLAIVRGMLAGDTRQPALATLAIAYPTLNLWIGLAEGGVMAFGCAGLFFIRRGSFRTGALFLGLAAWSKNEGLALIAVSVVAIVLATRSLRKLVDLWPAVALIAPWMITRAVMNLPTDFVQGSMTSRILGRLRNPAEVWDAFVKSPPDQPWFWLFALLAVVVFGGQAIRRETYLLVAVALQLGLMLAQGLATTWDFAAHVSLTLNRLPHQIAPALGFLAVVLLARELWPVAVEQG
jgi:hypothetical protein